MLNIPALAATIVPLVNLGFSCPLNVTALGQSLFGTLTVNKMSNFACSDGGLQPSGFNTPIIESTGSIQEFKEYFEQRQALSIEAWITPKSTSSFDTQPILTIGRKHDDFRTLRPTDGCHDYDLRLSQYGPYLQLSYTTATGTCESTTFNAALRVTALTHIALVFTSSSTTLYVDGQSIPSRTREFLNPQLGNWNSTYGLQLFSDYVPSTFDTKNSSTPMFTGAMHLIKMYSFGLKPDDASILFQAGLPTGLSTNGGAENQTIDQTLGNATTATATHPTQPPRLTATFDDILLREDKVESPFKIGGFLYGLNFAPVVVEIISLPSQGTLTYNGEPVLEGALLPTDEDVMTRLTYGGVANDLFNTPDTTANGEFLGIQPDSFSFRLVEMSDGGAKSEIAKVLLRVLNVNDVPEVTVPEAVYLTGEETPLGFPYYVIQGIHIDDAKDRDVDKVRIDVEALHGNGQLTLNQGFLESAEFSRCAIRTFSDWRCKGDGTRGTSMTFITTPSDANRLLSGLTYSPYFRNRQDEIRIRVYDGEGGDCLDAEEHQLYGNTQLSIHPRCVRKQGTVLITRPSETQLVDGADGCNASNNGKAKSFLAKVTDSVFEFCSEHGIEVIVGVVVIFLFALCYWKFCIQSRPAADKEAAGMKKTPMTKFESV